MILVDFIVVSDGVFSNTKSIVENKSILPIYNGSIAIRTILKNTPEFNYDKNSISLIMLKNAHIVIYPINKKGELNVVCIIRQKLSNNIDLKALIKKEIISQNKNLKIFLITNWNIGQFILQKNLQNQFMKIYFI